MEDEEYAFHLQFCFLCNMDAKDFNALECLATKAIGCRICFDKGEVQPARINRAQPRWVGPRYWEMLPRILIVLINPGSGESRPASAHDSFLSLLDGYAENRVTLTAIMEYQKADMPNWGNRRYARFYLNGLGLELDNIAFANIAWCATQKDKRPSSMLSRCFSLYTLPLVKLLAPNIVLLSGSKTHKFEPDIQRQLPEARIITMFHFAHWWKGSAAKRAELDRVRNLINDVAQLS